LRKIDLLFYAEQLSGKAFDDFSMNDEYLLTEAGNNNSNNYLIACLWDIQSLNIQIQIQIQITATTLKNQ
jgi:hypothetical protein